MTYARIGTCSWEAVGNDQDRFIQSALNAEGDLSQGLLAFVWPLVGLCGLSSGDCGLWEGRTIKGVDFEGRVIQEVLSEEILGLKKYHYQDCPCFSSLPKHLTLPYPFIAAVYAKSVHASLEQRSNSKNVFSVWGTRFLYVIYFAGAVESWGTFNLSTT